MAAATPGGDSWIEGAVFWMLMMLALAASAFCRLVGKWMLVADGDGVETTGW